MEFGGIGMTEQARNRKLNELTDHEFLDEMQRRIDSFKAAYREVGLRLLAEVTVLEWLNSREKRH